MWVCFVVGSRLTHEEKPSVRTSFSMYTLDFFSPQKTNSLNYNSIWHMYVSSISYHNTAIIANKSDERKRKCDEASVYCVIRGVMVYTAGYPEKSFRFSQIKEFA